MAKILNALILILMIEIGLYLFAGADYSSTALFNLALNPGDIISSAFYTLIFIALGLFAGGAIIVGAFSTTISFAIYAGISLALITFLSVFGNLARFITASLETANPMFIILVNFIVITPLAIYYGLAVIEWVRSNQ